GFVLGTGKLWLKVPPTMRFVFHGNLPPYLMAKDLILAVIGDIGCDGATYRAMEFDGDGVYALNIEERMTLCNMVIEAGGKNGDWAYISSCNDSKYTDFRAAACLLKGKAVKIDTFVDPATSEIAAQMKTEKVGDQTIEEVFLSAGAKVGPPSCAACLGGPSDTFGRLNEPLSCISTTNRNFPGRMGHKQAKVFLASPLTVAASAIAGSIADPREFEE